MQYAEERGAALLDLAVPRLNPFHRAGLAYFEMCKGPVMDGYFGPLFLCFAPVDDPGHDALLTLTRANAVHRAAHLWIMLIVPSGDFPVQWIVMVDERASALEQDAIPQKAYTKNRCCLNPDFTLKAIQCKIPLSLHTTPFLGFMLFS